MDTVPPFIPSSETPERIYGRGSCDAKGIIVAQIAAAEELKAEGIYAGLLFLVGEERDSQGAQTANLDPRGTKFLINGEPTENRIALASKGTLRVEVVAKGRMAHSAYPELGESAIEKLLDALENVRKMKLPTHPKAGPSTMNIGLIEGGRAPNVIPDHAMANLLIRLVGPAEELRQQIATAVAGKAEANFILEIPFMELGTVPGIDTMIAAFTTDIPALYQLGNAGADRARLDSRGAHRRRAHRKEAIDWMLWSSIPALRKFLLRDGQDFIIEAEAGIRSLFKL